LSANLDDLVDELAGAARELVRAAGAAGLMPRVTSTVRSRAEQTRLYRRSQQGLQPYPVAPPGFSAHEYGWAFDLVVSPFDAIYDVAYTWQQWGGAWNSADAVHFELPGASAEAKRLGGSAGGASGDIDKPWWWDFASMFLPLEAIDLGAYHSDPSYKAHVEKLADQFLRSKGL
jgi:hypothetical protein